MLQYQQTQDYSEEEKGGESARDLIVSASLNHEEIGAVV